MNNDLVSVIVPVYNAEKFIRETIQTVLNEATLTIGEKITVRRFARYEMGEGLEKRQDNLAEEVAKQMAGK